MQLPTDYAMVQCRGGTDDTENKLARNRQINSNPTCANMRGKISRGIRVRSSDFARHTKIIMLAIRDYSTKCLYDYDYYLYII